MKKIKRLVGTIEKKPADDDEDLLPF